MTHILHETTKTVANGLIECVKQHVPEVQVVFLKRLLGERIRDTTDVYLLIEGKEKCEISIVIGDPKSSFGPYDKMCWVFLDQGTPFFRRHKLAHRISAVINKVCHDNEHQSSCGSVT